MPRMSPRFAVALGTAVALVVPGVVALASSPARAITVTGQQSFVRFTGTGGDPVTLDRTWEFTPANSQLGTDHGTDRALQIGALGAPSWFIAFGAPLGQQLVAGEYTGAVRDQGLAPGSPGLFLELDGISCPIVNSSFTVSTAVFGPDGWVQSFHATFEQHCADSPDATVTGEVSIENGPPPPPLTVTFDVDPRVSVSRTGDVTLSATVSCTRPTDLAAFGRLTQRRTDDGPARTVTGTWDLHGTVPCGPTPSRVTVPVVPDGSARFRPGPARIDGQTDAFDAPYEFFRDALFTDRTVLRRTQSGHSSTGRAWHQV